MIKPLLAGRKSTVSKTWLLISISALILAGFLSLFIMLGRIPYINEWMFGTQWMRRILVVHVNLALLVSFYSFITAFIVMIPGSRQNLWRYPLAIGIAILSIFIMISSIFFTGSEAILTNYVPVIDHPVFIGSILLFGFAIGLTLFSRQLLSFKIQKNKTGLSLPASAVPLFQCAGALIFLSLIIFFISWLLTPANLDASIYYEFVIWGGGHILQFANMIAAAGIWFILWHTIAAQHLLDVSKVQLLSYVYTIPVLFSPLLLVQGTSNSLYLNGFTQYMKWGIFPIVSFIIILLISRSVTLLANRKRRKSIITNPYFTALSASILLTVIGFVLGSMIRGSNTMVPAHYHATLGAVTIAFMGATYWLLPTFGYLFSVQRQKKYLSKQLLIYATGQLIFVTGLAVAGTYGLARKVFGEEQLIDAAEIYIGLGLLLVGGLLAITGGILFLRNIIVLIRDTESR